MSHSSPSSERTVKVTSLPCPGVNARISSGRIPPGPPAANVSRTRPGSAPRPPASATTNAANATVPTPITAICPMSVATTPRSPPVAE